MIRKKVCLCGTFCVNFHSVAVKDTSCNIRLLANLILSEVSRLLGSNVYHKFPVTSWYFLGQ